MRVANFHALKLGMGLEAANLELFDYVGNTFKAMTIVLIGTNKQ